MQGHRLMRKQVNIWQSWRFKKGDKILFNDNSRFTYLYNNLKGIIVEIEKADDQIAFTIDVETIITEQQCKSDQIEYIDTIDEKTRIKLIVYAFDEDEVDDEENAKKTIIPFQLAPSQKNMVRSDIQTKELSLFFS